MKSADAFVRLYQAKKVTNFKNKKYPNTARQDLFEAVRLNHVGAIIFAAQDQLFASQSTQFFYLKLAEKLSINEGSDVRREVSDLIVKTRDSVPIFMRQKISTFVEGWDGAPIPNPPAPLCQSCKYLKRWDSEAPHCVLTASNIVEFVDECKFYSAVLADPEYVEEVKFNMDESYNDSDDD